jgi:uncharacterized protein (TIGR02594 family)
MTKMLTGLALVLILAVPAQAFDRHSTESYASLSQPSTHAVKHKSRHQIAPDHQPSYSGLVERARAYMGQTAAQLGLRRTAWCAAFMNKITGGGTGSDLAKSYLAKPRTAPQVGAIAVLSRGRGGHVGVVSGFDQHGNPIIISGNHNKAVGEGVYPKGRVLAYVSG